MMILLYHTSVKQQLKLAATYVFCYTVLWVFIPALLTSTAIGIWLRRKEVHGKPFFENHLKFVFMAVLTFVVLNAHNFILSLLQ